MSRRFQRDCLPSSVRSMLNSSHAYKEYLDAKAAARKWQSQGMERWAVQWESYAQSILRNPDSDKLKRPTCVHQSGETLRMQKTKFGYSRTRPKRQRPSRLSGVSSLGSKFNPLVKKEVDLSGYIRS